MQTNAFDAQYIPANDTPWFPYGQNGCRSTTCPTDPTTGQWIVKLRGPAGGNLGIHRHYGSVIAYTINGGWRYTRATSGSRAPAILCRKHLGQFIRWYWKNESEILFLVQGTLRNISIAKDARCP